MSVPTDPNPDLSRLCLSTRGHLVKWLRRTRLLGRVTGSSPVRRLYQKTSPRRAAKKKGTTRQKWAVANLGARKPRRVGKSYDGVRQRTTRIARERWLRETRYHLANR